ncbi:MAG: hypothetical protein EBZ50_13985 [Alphaproteobacteria bacterium]|jgi:hypothetical protein|nr:hypothetical protein [Alphaproteobacteria bacterium]
MTDAPIQIRHPDVVRDVRALAERLGLTMTEVIADAVRQRLAEEDAKAVAARNDRMKRAREVIARIDALPKAGVALSDVDLYDAEGFPREKGP